MALIKTFTIEVYDDPQLALKDGGSRDYFIGIEGLMANVEASLKDFLIDKNLIEKFRHKEQMEEIDKQLSSEGNPYDNIKEDSEEKEEGL